MLHKDMTSLVLIYKVQLYSKPQCITHAIHHIVGKLIIALIGYVCSKDSGVKYVNKIKHHNTTPTIGVNTRRSLYYLFSGINLLEYNELPFM